MDRLQSTQTGRSVVRKPDMHPASADMDVPIVYRTNFVGYKSVIDPKAKKTALSHGASPSTSDGCERIFSFEIGSKQTPLSTWRSWKRTFMRTERPKSQESR